jgi:hypothetical protein
MGRRVGLWGPRYADEPSDEKIDDVARILGIHRMQAYGHVSAFRAQVMIKTKTGRLTGSGVRVVESCAEWDGTPGALAHAFREAGLVTILPDGAWFDPRFMDYQGEAIAKAQAASVKARQNRAGGVRRVKRGADDPVDPRDGDTCDVTSVDAESVDTSSVTSGAGHPTHSLTHSDHDQDPEAQPETVVPTKPPHKPKRGGGITDYQEPEDVPSMLAFIGQTGKPLREFWAEKFPALASGASGRTLDEAVECWFLHWRTQEDKGRWPWRWPHQVIAEVTKLLVEDNEKAQRAINTNARTSHLPFKSRQPGDGEQMIDGTIVPNIVPSTWSGSAAPPATLYGFTGDRDE